MNEINLKLGFENFEKIKFSQIIDVLNLEFHRV